MYQMATLFTEFYNECKVIDKKKDGQFLFLLTIIFLPVKFNEHLEMYKMSAFPYPLPCFT